MTVPERTTEDGRRRSGVVQFTRKPGPGQTSIERIFEDVRRYLPDDLDVRVCQNLHVSRGVVPRLADAWRARMFRGKVNHILGDVHFMAMFFRRRGTVITVHDCGSLETKRGLKRWLLWLVWYKLPLRNAEKIVAVSNFTRDALLRWINLPVERIEVIPPTLSEEFTADLRRGAGPKPRILQIGSAPNKNVARIIDAISGIDVTLVMLGEPQAGVIQKLVDRGIDHESHFNLDRAEVVELYRSCDLVLFPSLYEGFGMPIIEAQAIGRPVVTSSLEPMVEVAGGGACFVDPFDAISIRRGIEHVLGDDDYASRLVALGFVNSRRFRAPKIAKQYERVYRELGA